MKTIGVLGGIGPQATTDFIARVHRASQRLIPPKGNSGYPPLVAYYLRHPPIRADEAGQPILPVEPDPRLFEVARWLGSRSDLLVVVANAPHLFLDEIAAAAGVKVLSMIGLAIEEARRREASPIGVLGLGQPRVYEVPLDRLGVPYKTISGDLRARLDAAILALMEGRESDEDRQVAVDAVNVLRERGAGTIILGCTEIPLLLGDASDAPDLINPTALLAEAAVRAALAD